MSNSFVGPNRMYFNDILWDYLGRYSLFEVYNDETLKTLTLDYDFMDNEYFELYVVNDSAWALYLTIVELFLSTGVRGFITYLKSGKPNWTRKG